MMREGFSAMRRSQMLRLPGLLARRAKSSSSLADAEPGNSVCSSSPSKVKQKKITDRLSSVVDAVKDRKLPPELRGRANAIRSETDIANVVEQRIWRSMEEGQFENLPGKGKPLDLTSNPHADPAEDTLYRILSRNGCAPEWIELNKEIRRCIFEFRLALKKSLAASDNLSIDDSESLKSLMADINSKVLRYNLMVPFGRQLFGLKWDKEVERITAESDPRSERLRSDPSRDPGSP
ncbi:uncharacterized protein LOC144715151 [Wolffia australiana]